MRDIFNYFDTPSKNNNPLSFSAIEIKLADPDVIRQWSHGEVKKPETINYRTLKPEREGLFCDKIFGPVRDYECHCGKYKRQKHRGVVCEKCGVEVIQSKVRRERLGHIELAVPVAHIWFLRSLPSRIGNMLDLSLKDVEKVLYCDSYIVTKVANESTVPLKYGQLMSKEDYLNALDQYEGRFEVGIGGEAIRDMLSRIDLEKLTEDLKTELASATSDAKKKKLSKRLKIAESFKLSGNKPENMMMQVIPVMPPDLRPLVPLEGGRFATSDLNDLYRRVINRNNRLKKLAEVEAPEIIRHNEMRMLQESVDALFDGSRRVAKTGGAHGDRPYKSLSDSLKGKQGRFRQNLLGKRVDYSGRSVITVGPELRLYQCGLPKRMALELFRPFICNRLMQDPKYADLGITTTKGAMKMVSKEDAVIWDILDEVIREHPVMLNRAPTLHRLGIQAFEPLLIEGKAIQLHPLVCAAFNADFDGDQMAVHVPLSIEAQIEARALMMSSNNILSPAHGTPIIVPSQDIVLGMYYLTRSKEFALGEGRVFSSPEEVRAAYDHGAIDLQAKIKCRILDGGERDPKEGEEKPLKHPNLFETTTGRVLLWEIVPHVIGFSNINKVMGKKELGKLIDICYRMCGEKETVLLADRVRTMGYSNATRAGISIGVKHMLIPATKARTVRDAQRKVLEFNAQIREGIITESEKHNKVLDLWATAQEKVASDMMKGICTETVTGINPETGKEETREQPSFNPIFVMADSGARGSPQQIRQLAGMRGLMAKPSGEIIETPITSNFREGLTVLQYFTSTHGARKGLSDTALKTANSGYLTRRLVDVAQDAIITEEDCGTTDGLTVGSILDGGEVIEALGERLLGRTAAEDIADAITGEVIVGRNEEITEEKVKLIEKAAIDKVKIRSALTCKAKHGVCIKCYGRDLARGHQVNIGEAVGVIAAQSIGEPGTQLTMRTFHVGGTASKSAEQSTLENRSEGRVKFVDLKTIPRLVDPPASEDREGDEKVEGLVAMSRKGKILIVDDGGRERETYPVTLGATIYVKEGQKVPAGTLLADWEPFAQPILCDVSGTVRFSGIKEGVSVNLVRNSETGFETKTIIESKDPNTRPALHIVDENGALLKIPGSTADAIYMMPTGATLTVEDGSEIKAGDVLAKTPREAAKTKDITGGLPRVAELFEARTPKDHAILADRDGIISFGKETKGKHKVIITPIINGVERHDLESEELIPKSSHLTVNAGDKVQAGEPLIDGPSTPHDILKVMGEFALSSYMVDEIQKVYRLQGVKINDKHIETIVRHMLQRVEITDPGDSKFLKDEQVKRQDFKEVNDQLIAEGLKPAAAEPMLLGITKASLSTESFIAAAAFQETTKVLTEAAICGKIDYLRGPKENIIMGRLIPAGTGLSAYRHLGIVVDYPEVEEDLSVPEVDHSDEDGEETASDV